MFVVFQPCSVVLVISGFGKDISYPGVSENQPWVAENEGQGTWKFLVLKAQG